MSEVKIYRGTKLDTGESCLIVKDANNFPMIEIYNDRVQSVPRLTVYRERNDLTELTFHPKGEGVWIGGDKATRIIHFLGRLFEDVSTPQGKPHIYRDSLNGKEITGLQLSLGMDDLDFSPEEVEEIARGLERERVKRSALAQLTPSAEGGEGGEDCGG